MAPETVNADFSRHVVVDTNAMDWRASPSPKVWRKRLDLTGDSESSRVTSLVRYDAGSVFPSHPHPDGEEILVLDGVFSDEHGDYPAGTYLLNPEGFVHAPYSEQGCVLFVKLRQFPGKNRQHVIVDTKNSAWQKGAANGAERLPLYAAPGYPEKVWLSRMAPGTQGQEHSHPGGEEMFVLDGSVEDELGAYAAGTWVRRPVGSRHTLVSGQGAIYYVKVHHLNDIGA